MSDNATFGPPDAGYYREEAPKAACREFTEHGAERTAVQATPLTTPQERAAWCAADSAMATATDPIILADNIRRLCADIDYLIEACHER